MPLSKTIAFAACLCLLPDVAAAAPEKQPGLLKQEFLYDKAPFPSAHASTIVETTNGHLVAGYFGGKHEKHPSVGIWVQRFADGKWTEPVEVANGEQPGGKRLPCWNPVLFQPKKGPLMLFWKVGPDPKSWWGMLRTSADDGKTWSDARRLPDGFLGPIKNKPIELADGPILCPSSTESSKDKPAWRVHFETSTDAGKTWMKAAPPVTADSPNAIQPSILVHPGGTLQALCRSKSGVLVETWSTDNGVTWSALAPTALPNPSSGIDALTLRDGRHLLVYNHSARSRSPLNVAVSADSKEWKAALVLEDAVSQPGDGFAYPACIQTKDGLVHITYTWRRQKIVHAVLDPTKLELKPLWPRK